VKKLLYKKTPDIDTLVKNLNPDLDFPASPQRNRSSNAISVSASELLIPTGIDHPWPFSPLASFSREESIMSIQEARMAQLATRSTRSHPAPTGRIDPLSHHLVELQI
jgi:hypothetical protein